MHVDHVQSSGLWRAKKKRALDSVEMELQTVSFHAVDVLGTEQRFSDRKASALPRWSISSVSTPTFFPDRVFLMQLRPDSHKRQPSCLSLPSGISVFHTWLQILNLGLFEGSRTIICDSEQGQ